MITLPYDLYFEFTFYDDRETALREYTNDTSGMTTKLHDVDLILSIHITYRGVTLLRIIVEDVLDLY